jgi:hypothetical protein
LSNTDTSAGAYLHPSYVQSLQEWGRPRALPQSGGWILERNIPETPYIDAIGCYPLFMCQHWNGLDKDLLDLGDELVSLAVVTDPFGAYKQEDLLKSFDKVIRFKEHFVADLELPINEIVSRHHRYYSRKCLELVKIETSTNPIEYLDEWVQLYSLLSEKIGITGLRAFSRQAFQKQFSIPGLVMFRALQAGRMIGAAICMIHGDVAYGHLMGINEAGYRANVSYGLYWAHITCLAGKVRWIDWGGTSGIQGTKEDGLSLFKRGWSTGTRPAYFCGKIFNRDIYNSLLKNKPDIRSHYFPAYRAGEMT